MKKIMVMMIFLICATFTTAITQSYPEENLSRTETYIIESPIVKVTQLKYEPYPVEPGTYFTMWLRVDNIADEDAENVQVEVVDNYPFKIEGEKTKTVGKLGRRQSSVIYFEKIRVDDKAIEGDNEIEVRINMGGGYKKEYSIQKLKVKVQLVEPVLSLTITSKPERIPQGGVSNVSVEVQNMDNGMIKDINLKLVLPSTFVPVGSTSEKKIQRLNPGESSSIEYQLMVLADSEAKAYQLEIDVSYSDQTGTRYSKNETLGLMVGAEPAYTLNLESSDTFQSGTKGKVTVSISNTGPSQLKFLTLEVLPSEDYTVLSTTKSYLGNLDPDDFETSEYTIYAGKSGDVPIKLKVSYKDSYNNEKQDLGEVQLKVYSSWEMRKYGLGTGGTGLLTWIIYILLIIFVYLGFKEWRKERDVGRAMKNALRRMILGFINLLRQLKWSNLKRIPRRIKLFLQQ
ncbi:MAG: COG1361 S-layer family protein [archaeon]